MSKSMCADQCICIYNAMCAACARLCSSLYVLHLRLNKLDHSHGPSCDGKNFPLLLISASEGFLNSTVRQSVISVQPSVLMSNDVRRSASKPAVKTMAKLKGRITFRQRGGYWSAGHKSVWYVAVGFVWTCWAHILAHGLDCTGSNLPPHYNCQSAVYFLFWEHICHLTL